MNIVSKQMHRQSSLSKIRLLLTLFLGFIYGILSVGDETGGKHGQESIIFTKSHTEKTLRRLLEKKVNNFCCENNYAFDKVDSPESKALAFMSQQDDITIHHLFQRNLEQNVILIDDDDSITTEQKINQRYALLALWYSLSNSTSSSLPRGDECTWREITCSDGGRITELHLARQKGWNGVIPPSIGLLTNVRLLDLAENSIQGRIPNELYELKDLKYLYLHDNQITGTLSERIGKLKDLVDLYLGNNKFTGTLPNDLRAKEYLRYLSLGNNNFSGEFPSDLSLRRLFYLDLSFNNFLGQLDSKTFEGYERLRNVYLQGNYFSGTIPISLPKAGNERLRAIDVNHNMFVGGFPTPNNWVKKNSLLVTLNMKNNMFTKDIDDDLCDLFVLKSGELVQMDADCKICKCRGKSLCDRCTYPPPPTSEPTKAPTSKPTRTPVTMKPTDAATEFPSTYYPTSGFTSYLPTYAPTSKPTRMPVTIKPTDAATDFPSTYYPTPRFTSYLPTFAPTSKPTDAATKSPTAYPTPRYTSHLPTVNPTIKKMKFLPTPSKFTLPTSQSPTAFNNNNNNSTLKKPIVVTTPLFKLSPVGHTINGGGNTSDWLITSISLSSTGERVAIGYPYQNQYRGIARVYEVRRDDDDDDKSSAAAWVPIGDAITGMRPLDRFGYRLSLSSDGESIAVASRSSNYILTFRYVDGVWKRQGQELDGGLVSLSHDGGRLAMGGDDETNNDRKMRLYEYDPSLDVWIQLGGDIVKSYYSTVTISGDGRCLAIGESYYNSNNMMITELNHVQIFCYSLYDRELIPIGNTTINGNYDRDYFGNSIALNYDGTVVAAGTLTSNYVKVFKYDGNDWKQLGEDITGSGSRFGRVISINGEGDRLIVGTPSVSRGQSMLQSSGKVMVYQYDNLNFRWRTITNVTLKNGDNNHNNRLGWTISMSPEGDHVAVGGFSDVNVSQLVKMPRHKRNKRGDDRSREWGRGSRIRPKKKHSQG